jgi:hypothetical protein
MPGRTDAPPTATPAERLRVQIAGGLSAARLRTGLSEQQVADLLRRRGFEVSAPALRDWESSGLLRLESAVCLADAYGTTMDVLAGRRAFRQRRPTDDLPPPSRSAW